MFSKPKIRQKLMRFEFNTRANFTQHFCCYVSNFVMPNSWEASIRARQAMRNVQPIIFSHKREGTSISGQLYCKHNASRNAALLRQKQCSSNGNVVSQFDAPLSSASSNSSEYGPLTSNCNIKSFFLWARRSFSFCCSVDFRFCLLVILSTSVSLDKNFSTRGLHSLSESLNF